MLISVVVCSHNRAFPLKRLLSSFTRLLIPDGVTWEIIIIDNGSTDSTKLCVDTFRERLPMTYVFELEPGVSAARNRAIEVAKGDYLLWTDDDCEADPLWLASYVSMFECYPNAALFAGPIMPQLQTPVTIWFAETIEKLEWVVAARDFGPSPLELTICSGQLPFGANAAVRAVEQRRHRYDPSLGVKLNRRMVGEETSVYHQILSSAGRGIWVPDARITHHITRSRQSLSYIKDYYSGHGAFGVYKASPQTGMSKLQLIFHYSLRLVINYIAFKLTRWLTPPQVWLKYWTNVGSHLGSLRYLYFN